MSSTELTKAELNDLLDYEQDIETGKQMVGRALKEIRDRKLWRAGFHSFEEYVSQRWRFQKSYAYYSIRAFEVSTIVENPALTGNESRARALTAGLNDYEVLELAAAVTEHCEETGEEPTAKVICDVKARVLHADDVPEEEAEPQEQDEAVAAELLEPEPEPSPIEEAIRAGQGVCTGLRHAINAARRIIWDVTDEPGLEILVGYRRSIVEKLDVIKGQIGVSTPEAACPKCKGKKCDKCGNTGWVNKELADG